MFLVDLLISKKEIEPVYEHVHHAQALHFLEQARLRYLESFGLPNESLLARNLFLVITHIQIEYRRELRQGPIQVSCENPRAQEKSLFLDQRILNERGKLAVAASFEMKFIDGALKRSVAPPDDFLALFLGGKSPTS